MPEITLRHTHPRITIKGGGANKSISDCGEYLFSNKDLKQLAVFLWHVSEGKEFSEAEKLSVEYYEKKLQ